MSNPSSASPVTDPPVAAMISAAQPQESAPLFRGEFTLDRSHGEVVSATMLATAHGVCEVTLNGVSASDALLTPGWSSYEWRLRYAQWEVSALLHDVNVIGVVVGAGWHSGQLGWSGRSAVYGDRRAALVELRVTFEDGHVQTVGTDRTWLVGPSHVLADDLYDGQTIDARALDQAWTRPGAALDGWRAVEAVDIDRTMLTPYVSPPVVRQDERAAERIWRSPSGRLLVDFGQNLVGWVRVSAVQPEGTVLTLRHAEVLDDGEIGVRPLRLAKATDRFVCSGGEDVFEPTLTFHGFRYLEIDGWTGDDEELAAALTAVVIGSDLRRTGTFASSDPLLNRLHENVVWGMRGNFVDVPTDCPQRDERLGWTGDLAAFVDTAAYLYDVDAFLHDWLLDLSAEQTAADGRIPVVVPDSLKYEETGELAAIMGSSLVIALWNDAACWVPWSMYEAYGDESVLIRQYASMTGHVRRVANALSDRGLLEGGFQLGDWLDPTAPPDAPHQAKADAHVVASACVYRSAVIARDAALLLGHDEDADEFAVLARRIRAAFNRHHVAGGRITSDAPTVYALAISFDLLDEPDRTAAGRRLAALVAEGGHRILTGFAGTPFVLSALSDTGHIDTAYRLLFQRECPSWLYPVTMGATTMWERWDSMLPDGSINPGEMTSFNHYAFGAVATWMHRVIAGLAPAAPGYRRLRIAPRPPRDSLTSASATLETPLGLASSAWEIADGEFTLRIVVPAGATAAVALPSGACHTVEAGEHVWREPHTVAAEADIDEAVAEVLSERARAGQLAERAALLDGADFWRTKSTDGIRALVLSDGPHGLRYQDGEADHLGINDSRPATCFPPSAAIGATWDPAIARAVAAAIGAEARAAGVDVVLGPGINIRRSPLGGRGFEYYSEDPLLTGVLGSAWVRGLQSTGVGASLKHFAVNSQETDRMRVDADVDMRTLREIYLRAFERVVRDADPATVMSAYNAVNGAFASENHWLLTEVLRDEWGFDGLVVSDWGAVKDRAAALAAGLDLEMPASSGRGTAAILARVADGSLDAGLIDTSVARLRALAARTAPATTAREVDADAHHAVARRAAAAAIVLLRNERETLPLADPSGVRIAAFGAFAADAPIQGGGSSRVQPTRLDTPLDALRGALGDVRFAVGYGTDDDDAALTAAVELASRTDVALVFVGIPESAQSEGRDRDHLDLPADHVALIRAVAAVAERTVVVLMNGGIVTLEPWHDDVDAIVETWVLGQAAGGAIVDVLTGAVNPSGRLPETIPLRLLDTPTALAFPGEQGVARYGEGIFVGYRGYLSVDRPVRYPFGHGLSYTTFEQRIVSCEPVADDAVRVVVEVSNTGDRDGAEIVQVYVAAPDAPVRRPLRELAGFVKADVAAGMSETVEIDLDRRSLERWDVIGDRWIVDPGVRRVELGRSAADIVDAATVLLVGDRATGGVLTETSTVGEWFRHPIVAPALRQLMGSTDDPLDNPDFALVESMPMTQFLRFIGADVPEAALAHCMAMSRA